MLFPTHIIDIIANCAKKADLQARADLKAGVIVSENDYTSNFTSTLRKEIDRQNISNLNARIQVIKPSAERKYGTDGCIILSNNKEFKVGLFEAKLTKANKVAWDTIQKTSKISHFDDQISRQKYAISQGAAVWEMFYSEHDSDHRPPYMSGEGSACVWHDKAIEASNLREEKKPWTHTELEKLLQSGCCDIASILRQICECTKGKTLAEQNYTTAISHFVTSKKAVVITYE